MTIFRFGKQNPCFTFITETAFWFDMFTSNFIDGYEKRN